jgi:hypothetical protein
MLQNIKAFKTSRPQGNFNDWLVQLSPEDITRAIMSSKQVRSEREGAGVRAGRVGGLGVEAVGRQRGAGVSFPLPLLPATRGLGVEDVGQAESSPVLSRV